MRTALVYNFLLEANIMASIAIVLMFFVRKFFRKQLGNRAIRYAWLLVVARLLLPISLPNPFISEIRPAYLSDAAIRPIAGQIKIRLQDALEYASWRLRGPMWPENLMTNALGAARDRMFDGTSAAILMRIYLAGVMAVLLWFLVSNLLFRWKMRAGRIEPISGELKEKFDQLCKERKVKPVPVYFTDPLASACLVGVFGPYIALPLTARPDEEIQVLTHEICHLKGRDHLWSLVRLICCAVHWFNPLVWLAAGMSRTDCELACDDRVISRMDEAEKRDYASVLVLAAARRNSPGLLTMATGMTMTGKRLKDRVDGILHSGTVKRGAALAFSLLASMCLVGAFATSEVQKTWNIKIPQPDNRADWTLDVEMLAHLENDQDDLDAYAVGVWDGELVHEEEIGIPFSVTKTSEAGRMIMDQNGALVLIYGEDGKLQQISNQQSHYEDAAWVEPEQGDDTPAYTLIGTDEQAAKTITYLASFLYQFAPDLLNADNSYTIDGLYKTEDQYFIEFTIRHYDKDAGKESHLGQIEIEAAPDFRVVRFIRFGADDDTSFLGNG